MEVPISMSLVAWLILVLAEDSWLSIAPTIPLTTKKPKIPIPMATTIFSIGLNFKSFLFIIDVHSRLVNQCKLSLVKTLNSCQFLTFSASNALGRTRLGCCFLDNCF